MNVSAVPPNVSPIKSNPSPPPNPPGFGAPIGATFPVQNVFTTIATCDGPPGVIVTFAGSGMQVIEGAGCPSVPVTVQPNVTVPLNPGVAVSTIPTASFPPGGTGGIVPPGGGVTEIVMGEFVSVRSVEPVTSSIDAEIVVLNSASPPVIASPPGAIVAASVFDEAHVTVAVMSFVV